MDRDPVVALNRKPVTLTPIANDPRAGRDDADGREQQTQPLVMKRLAPTSMFPLPFHAFLVIALTKLERHPVD